MQGLISTVYITPVGKTVGRCEMVRLLCGFLLFVFGLGFSPFGLDTLGMDGGFAWPREGDGEVVEGESRR